MIWQKATYKLKWWFRDLQGSLGVSFSVKKGQGEVRILCFHGLCKDEQSYINARFLKESHLKSLLVEVQQHFNVISLDEYLNGKIDSEKLNVLLTFDDGYKNNKTLLLPILEELQLPATFFVLSRGNKPLWMDLLDILFAQKVNLLTLKGKYGVTASNNQEFKVWMNQQHPSVIDSVTKKLEQLAQPFLQDYLEFWQLLSKEELIELNEHPLITLCNHTANHYNMTLLDNDQLKKELQECSQYLEEIGTNFPNILAFPFGIYDVELCHSLEQLNYPIYFSVEESSEDRAIHRLVVNPFISVRNQLISIVDGKY